jgi:hypothetical protein
LPLHSQNTCNSIVSSNFSSISVVFCHYFVQCLCTISEAIYRNRKCIISSTCSQIQQLGHTIYNFSNLFNNILSPKDTRCHQKTSVYKRHIEPYTRNKELKLSSSLKSIFYDNSFLLETSRAEMKYLLPPTLVMKYLLP